MSKQTPYKQYHQFLDGVRVPDVTRTQWLPKDNPAFDPTYGRGINAMAIHEAHLTIAGQLTWEEVEQVKPPTGNGVFDIPIK